ncbi:hypothetical protein A6R68_11838 [Neotoma lepida]|uniref:Disks large homolog 5 N-terminal domain-containing protein n=1 Tax=Neotoma lepida TaxID=56216 RepID=A0A1A6FV89_NEOLE|nr:hypothetical protein A6R68_11838 [Neotoma lepida]
MEPSSHPTVHTKKQVKREMERLTMELKLASQGNELRDRLIFITEGTVDKSYGPGVTRREIWTLHNT